MRISPLRLKNSIISGASFRSSDQFVPKGQSGSDLPPELKAEVSRAKRIDGHREWRVELKVSLEEGPSVPYFFSITVVGYFEISEEIDDSTSENIVAVNGPTLLFGSAREFITLITGRGPHGPFQLPAVSFVDEIPSPVSVERSSTPSEPNNPGADRRSES